MLLPRYADDAYYDVIIAKRVLPLLPLFLVACRHTLLMLFSRIAIADAIRC